MKPATHVLLRKVCEHCGFKFPASEANCAACGRLLVDIAISACMYCGVSLEPDQDACDPCKAGINREQIRPLVEAAVVDDKKLSKQEKEFLLRTASLKGIPDRTTEDLITELLSELGATDESQTPVLTVGPRELSCLGVERGSEARRSLTIQNTGGGQLRATIFPRASWLKVSPLSIDLQLDKQIINVIVDTNLLAYGANEKGVIHIDSNVGSIDVDVFVQVKPLDAQAGAQASNRLVTKPLQRDKSCSRCQTLNAQGDRLCDKCGWDLSRTYSKPAPKADRAGAADPVSESGKGEKRSRPLAYVVVALLAFMVVAVVVRQSRNSISASAPILERLEKNDLVTPVGSSAYDLWKDLKSKDPDSSALTEVSKKALPLLRSRGEEAVDRWHDESQEGDQQWSELSRIYEWAAQLDPADKKLQALRGYCVGKIAFSEKRFDDALTAYTQALESNQCMSLAYNGIGRVHANKDEYAKAAEYYNRAISCEPDWCYPYFNLAGVYWQTSRYEEAEETYKRAINSVPGKSSPHYKLAQFYEFRRRYCDAASEYRQVIDLARNEPDQGFTIKKTEKHLARLAGKCGS